MKIPFEPEYRDKFYQILNEAFESNFWSDGPILRRFDGAALRSGARRIMPDDY